MRALSFAGLLFAGTVLAEGKPVAGVEIDALLLRLQTSGCQFQRNGSWHGGAEASRHLQRKREHIESKAALQSAEQFIQLAASKSSSSGKPYEVRCAQAQPQASASWLLAELQTIRATKAKPKS